MNNPVQHTYPKYKYLALVLYCLMSFLNGMQWSTFMPITKYTCTILHITELKVYMIGVVYFIGYPVVYFFANYAIDQKGLRYGLNVGAIFTMCGAILRCFAFAGYYPLIIGQCLNSIGQPFILNAPSKLVNDWFEPKLRPFFTTISGSVNLLGLAMGFIIPILFVKPGHLTIKDITYLLITEAVIIVVGCCLQLIFFRNSPYKQVSTCTKLWDCSPYRELCKNKSYVLFMVSTSLSIGNFQTLSTVIEELLGPFGFTPNNFSEIGFVLLIGGVVEAIAIGAIVNKTKRYRLIFMISLGLSQMILFCFYFILEYQKLSLLIFATLVLSPGMVYITPLAMDYAPILTPCIGESASCGAIMACGQIASIAMISVCNKIQEITVDGKKSSMYVIIILGIVNAIEIVLGAFVKPNSLIPISVTEVKDSVVNMAALNESTQMLGPETINPNTDNGKLLEATNRSALTTTDTAKNITAL